MIPDDRRTLAVTRDSVALVRDVDGVAVFTGRHRSRPGVAKIEADQLRGVLRRDGRVGVEDRDRRDGCALDEIPAIHLTLLMATQNSPGTAIPPSIPA